MSMARVDEGVTLRAIEYVVAAAADGAVRGATVIAHPRTRLVPTGV